MEQVPKKNLEFKLWHHSTATFIKKNHYRTLGSIQVFETKGIFYECEFVKVMKEVGISIKNITKGDLI